MKLEEALPILREEKHALTATEYTDYQAFITLAIEDGEVNEYIVHRDLTGFTLGEHHRKTYFGEFLSGWGGAFLGDSWVLIELPEREKRIPGARVEIKSSV